MSSRQWGAIMEGDESYAGARSFYRLEKVIQDITGMQHFVPTHQGRAAEKVLFTAVCKKGDLVPNNCHFDTTRANLEYLGIEAVDLVIPEGLQPALIYPFKGNIDLARAEAVLQKEGARIPFGMITVTNNTGGGQPVSMANIRAYSRLCSRSTASPSSWMCAASRKTPCSSRCASRATRTPPSATSSRKCSRTATAPP
ncbi:MAG: beta-eliminating lyase-related protein [Giesbergeria sp.]